MYNISGILKLVSIMNTDFKIECKHINYSIKKFGRGTETQISLNHFVNWWVFEYITYRMDKYYFRKPVQMQDAKQSTHVVFVDF